MYQQFRTEIAESTRPGTMNSMQPEAIFTAAKSNDVPTVELLLSKFPGCLNIRDSDHMTPLALSASTGSVKVMMLLLEKGAKVNAKTLKRWTPLHQAARFGKTDCVSKLIQHGADINRPSIRKQTPLMLACLFGQETTAATLIKGACDVNASEMYGRTALHFAVKSGSIKCVELLLQANKGLEINDNFGKTPLFQAVKSNKPDVLKILLKAGASTDVRDKNRKSVMDIAVEKGCVDCIDVLKDAGVTIDGQRASNKPPAIVMAADGCRLSLVKQLLYRGADPNESDRHGTTPLTALLVALSRHIRFNPEIPAKPWLEIGLALVKANCDVNIPTRLGGLFMERGQTPKPHTAPVELAVKCGYSPFVQLLMQAGCNVREMAPYFDKDSNTLPKSLQKQQQLLQYLKDCSEHPLNLNQLCRKKILSILGTNPQSKIAQLAGPLSLKNYLTYSDLETMVKLHSAVSADLAADEGMSDSETEYEVSAFDSDAYGDSVIVDTE